jgi:hypothetical protein
MSDSTTEATTVTKPTKVKKEPKAKKEPKVPKAKKDKYNGFTVPNKTSRLKACCHIFEMIKEANPDLLDKEDVKKAYNDFVACCEKYDTLESWIPSKSYKYKQNIKLESPSTNQYNIFRGLNFRWPYMYNNWHIPTIKKEIIENTNAIIESYTVLYDLIKRDVVPYMERKQWELTKDKDIEQINEQISRYEAHIKYLEKTIIENRANICNLAKKAIDTMNPPEPTKFD